jgi:NADPH:quinone reductase-like Zn-dependent oxidoreductase
MKAVVLKGYGGLDQLSFEDVETPTPGDGEVLVRVAATSLNPVDWKLRVGELKEVFPLQFPAILGRDLAGEIIQLGAGVSGFKAGDRVMALANKTYAEYVAIKAEELTRIPEGLSFDRAAALPLVTLTGAALFERGVNLKGGQALLLTGAVGGVGRTVAYVAATRHVQVIAVVRAAQLAEAESLGTLAVVALDDEQGLAKFQEIDGVADTVGHNVAVSMLKHLRHGGVFASVVGIPKEVADYDIRAEMVVVKPDAARLSQLAEDVAQGRFDIPIAKTLKLSDIKEAHRLGEAGGVGGKIILVL